MSVLPAVGQDLGVAPAGDEDPEQDPEHAAGDRVPSAANRPHWGTLTGACRAIATAHANQPRMTTAATPPTTGRVQSVVTRKAKS